MQHSLLLSHEDSGMLRSSVPLPCTLQPLPTQEEKIYSRLATFHSRSLLLLGASGKSRSYARSCSNQIFAYSPSPARPASARLGSAWQSRQLYAGTLLMA